MNALKQDDPPKIPQELESSKYETPLLIMDLPQLSRQL
jgi:hypothetical protein